MLISFGLPQPGSARLWMLHEGDLRDLHRTYTLDWTAASFFHGNARSETLYRISHLRVLFVNDLHTRMRYFQCVLHLCSTAPSIYTLVLLRY